MQILYGSFDQAGVDAGLIGDFGDMRDTIDVWKNLKGKENML